MYEDIFSGGEFIVYGNVYLFMYLMFFKFIY